MAAIRHSVQRSHTLHDLRLTPYGVARGELIPDGAMVCLNAQGLAVNAADDPSLVFAGMAYRGYDNSEGPDGFVGQHSERFVEVENNGPWAYDVTGPPPVAGADAFVVDNATVSADAKAYSLKAGVFTRPHTGGQWFVDHEKA